MDLFVGEITEFGAAFAEEAKEKCKIQLEMDCYAMRNKLMIE